MMQKTSFSSFYYTQTRKQYTDTHRETYIETKETCRTGCKNKQGIIKRTNYPHFKSPLLGNGNWNDQSYKSYTDKHAVEVRNNHPP